MTTDENTINACVKLMPSARVLLDNGYSLFAVLECVAQRCFVTQKEECEATRLVREQLIVRTYRMHVDALATITHRKESV